LANALVKGQWGAEPIAIIPSLSHFKLGPIDDAARPTPAGQSTLRNVWEELKLPSVSQLFFLPLAFKLLAIRHSQSIDPEGP
jgi:hypothetical protein